MQLWIVLYQMCAQLISITSQPVFWIAIMLLMIQNSLQLWRKQSIMTMQKQTAARLPAFLFTVFEQVLYTLLVGFFGGTITSIFFLLTGISLDPTTLLALWLVMIVLYLFQHRFLCFAYAGGLLVLLQNSIGCTFFDGKQILFLVAILHFTEAILVRISGTLQRIPIYLRNEQGSIIIGTQMQMTWPIPFAMATPNSSTETIILQHGCVVLPDWWPLFHVIDPTFAPVQLYHFIPMLAMIGYQDFAVWGNERKQTQKTAFLLFMYSSLLFILVGNSQAQPRLLLIAAIFSILGHEGILWLGNMHMRKYVHKK